MIKSALCTVLLVATATPAFAEKPDLSDPKLSKILMQLSNGKIVRRPETCGTPQIPMAPTASPGETEYPSFALSEPQIVYLNPNGGTYTTGAQTSAANNTIRSAQGFRTGTVTPLPTGEFDWPTIVQCVRATFSPFNITVVETEPSGVPYVEAVVGGGDGSEVYGGGGLFGVAATDSFCNLFRTGIAFNFAGTHIDAFGGPQATQFRRFRDAEMCNTIVHEVGHVLGLEHKAWEADNMSYDYIQDSTAACRANPLMCKSLVDGSQPCGTFQQSPTNDCSCPAGSPGTTASNVNSYAKLMDYIGPSTANPDTVAPTLSIVQPTDFSSMPRDFAVTVMATDDRSLSSVSLLVDGIEVDSATEPNVGSSYFLNVADATEGPHTLVARAIDASGNENEVSAAFTVVLIQTGDECTTNEECSGGICASSPGGRFCTEECTGDSCPTDFSCTTISSGQMICVPDPAGTDDGDDMTDDTTDDTDGNNATDDGDGGGCCSSSSGTGALSGGLLALGVGLVVSRRRRQR